MRRRAFLVSSLGIATLPRISTAQRASKAVHVGWITATSMRSAAPFLNALRNGLASLGYVEGQNVFIEERYGDDVVDRVPRLTEELLRLPADILVSHGPGTGLVVQLAKSVPVVFVVSADPVETGLVHSLPRPGGNATGITLMSVELNGKRLELLREFLPKLRVVGILCNPLHGGEHLERLDSEQAAQRLGIAIHYMPVRNTAELEASFSAMASGGTEAIVVFPDALMVGNRQRIIDVGMAGRMPVISGWAIFARSGALCTYGPKLVASYQRAAYYVDRILKGTNPGDLPIERPSVFELIINMKAATALGLTIPASILARADEVIE